MWYTPHVMEELVIRPAREADAAPLVEIYAPYVRETAITFEYDVPSVEEFARRIRAVTERYPYLVAERAGIPVGYAYAGSFKERAAYGWAVEVSIYVERAGRRAGVGRKLYAALEGELCRMHVLNANACIAVPEQGEDAHLGNDSVAFHARLGYRMVGTFRQCGYKFGTWYGMAWMEKHLGGHGGNPLPVVPWPEARAGDAAQ